VRASSAAVLLACVLTLVTADCNTRNPIPVDAGSITPSPPPPTPVPAPPPVPVPSPVPLPAPLPAPLPFTVLPIMLDRSALFGGENTGGTVILSRVVSTGNIVVTLTSSDPSLVVVPPAVTIPQGSDRASFAIGTTRSVSDDQRVVISGSLEGSSGNATLLVWMKPQTFFTYFSEPGEFIGGGGYGRITSADTHFDARGDGTVVSVVTFPSTNWSLEFGAPLGRRLSVGAYENAITLSKRDQTHPGIDISGTSRGCTMTAGRFDVREVEIRADGVITRFYATYEQRCDFQTSVIRGEVRFVR